jgi:hypothetical protein
LLKILNPKRMKSIKQIFKQPALLFLLSVNSLLTFSQNDLKQTVRGQIVDADTKIPLIGATIVIEGIAPLMGTVADLDSSKPPKADDEFETMVSIDRSADFKN